MFIVAPLHQPKKAKTGAERARAYRQTAKCKSRWLAKLGVSIFGIADTGGLFVGRFGICEPPLTPPPTVTARDIPRDGDAPSRSISPILLQAAAPSLACVGISINGTRVHGAERAKPREHPVERFISTTDSTNRNVLISDP